MFRKLIEFYFAPRFWERSGRLYELLGIRFFKKYLPTSGDLIMRRVFHNKLLRNGRTETLEGYEKGMTRVCEVIHVIGFFTYSIPLFSGLPFGAFIAVVAVNLLVNVYPVMLQRYNRARIYRVLERRRSRELATTRVLSPAKQPYYELSVA